MGNKKMPHCIKKERREKAESLLQDSVMGVVGVVGMSVRPQRGNGT